MKSLFTQSCQQTSLSNPGSGQIWMLNPCAAPRRLTCAFSTPAAGYWLAEKQWNFARPVSTLALLAPVIGEEIQEGVYLAGCDSFAQSCRLNPCSLIT
jgi:hypothetical protein